MARFDILRKAYDSWCDVCRAPTGSQASRGPSYGFRVYGFRGLGLFLSEGLNVQVGPCNIPIFLVSWFFGGSSLGMG